MRQHCVVYFHIKVDVRHRDLDHILRAGEEKCAEDLHKAHGVARMMQESLQKLITDQQQQLTDLMGNFAVARPKKRYILQKLPMWGAQIPAD